MVCMSGASRFLHRSLQPEILDQPRALSPEETEGVLEELQKVNRWLGGTCAFLRAVTPKIRQRFHEEGKQRPIRILDLGAGSADLGRSLLDWARRKGVPVRVVALEINPISCRIARDWSRKFPEIQVVQGDLRSLPFSASCCDLVWASAVLHHFPDPDCVSILRQGLRVARSGFLFLDLHRHPVPYWGFQLFSRIFFRSPAVRHDGPLSILKGFRRKELQRLIRQAGVPQGRISWRWPFRWLVELPGWNEAVASSRVVPP